MIIQLDLRDLLKEKAKCMPDRRGNCKNIKIQYDSSKELLFPFRELLTIIPMLGDLLLNNCLLYFIHIRVPRTSARRYLIKIAIVLLYF
jgi:hypothetical protein